MTDRNPASPRRLEESAFTLVEALVCIAVIGVLVALGAGIYDKALEAGGKAREVSAARALISAYTAAAADADGGLMVAYYEGSAPGLQPVKMPDGETISGAELDRYPYRLAPYFGYAIDGVILTNRNKAQIPKAFGSGMETYGRSLCPAFGINYYFVGGYVVDNKLAGAAECVTRLAQAHKPSSLLVFATAFQEVNGQRVEGRFGVEPPVYRAVLWDANLHVDARHNGRAICAFLDGSVREYTIDELRDMRLWSNRAAMDDNPNYAVAATGNSGVGGAGGGRR